MILPTVSSKDERVSVLMDQLIQKLQDIGANIDLVTRDMESMTCKDEGVVIVPCITVSSSRLESDVNAALSNVKISKSL